jgi:hypothetical protein
MDRPRLRDVIRRKLDEGTLPTKAPNKIYTVYGSGATCDACGDPLQNAQVELSCPERTPHLPDAPELRRAVGSGAPDPRSRSRVVSRAGAHHYPAWPSSAPVLKRTPSALTRQLRQ